MTGLEDQVFNSGKHKHAAYFVNKCEAITKYIAVNYKQGGPEMAMAINKMDNSTIKAAEVPEDTSGSVDNLFVIISTNIL